MVCLICKLFLVPALLSILAFFYLVYREVQGEGLFSRQTEDILTRVAVGIFILSGLWYLYIWKKLSIFLWLMPVAFLPLVWLLLGTKFGGALRRMTKQPSQECWICQKCSEENHNIRKECFNCGWRRPD